MIACRMAAHKHTIAVASGLAGLALGTGLVLGLGAGQVVAAGLRVGWLGFAAAVGWQLLVFAALGAAWWIVCPGAGLGVVVWARLVREGGTTCLPFSVFGGLAFGTRAIVLGGLDLGRAAASTAADVISEGIALAPFFLFGLVYLFSREPGAPLLRPLALGFGVLAAGGSATWLGRAHLAGLLRTATGFLLRGWVEEGARRAEAVHDAMDMLFRRRARIAGATGAHLACWIAGAGNVWIGYRLLGARPSVVEALAIEALFSGALSVALLVPGAFGVQEASYVGIGRLFGIPAPLSLALSLLRRARDIAIGGPALLVWQGVEAKRLTKAA